QTLFNDIYGMFLPLANEKGLEFSKSIDKAIGSINCDKRRITQVLSNLLGNAIKFTPNGGKVSLNAISVGDETLVCVSDTGTGIHHEQLSCVFDRYWQGQKGNREGVGLGLAIAKGLIEAHGGRIWAESQVSEGSTFFFTLPVKEFKQESELNIG